MNGIGDDATGALSERVEKDMLEEDDAAIYALRSRISLFWPLRKELLEEISFKAILSLRGRNEVGVFLNGRFRPRRTDVGDPLSRARLYPLSGRAYDWRKAVRVGRIFKMPQHVPRSGGIYHLRVPWSRMRHLGIWLCRERSSIVPSSHPYGWSWFTLRSPVSVL
jgi:hypothetical protein